nr:eukaryotic translation initiation factor 3 subunit B-like [Tanacetum cinerariifolium]
MSEARRRAYAIDCRIWHSVVSSKMNQLHSFMRAQVGKLDAWPTWCALESKICKTCSWISTYNQISLCCFKAFHCDAILGQMYYEFQGNQRVFHCDTYFLGVLHPTFVFCTAKVNEDGEDENDFLVQLCKLSNQLLMQRGKIPLLVPPPKHDDASVKIEEDSLPEKDDVVVANDESSRVVLNIFNVISGKVMRDFKGSANKFAIGGSGSSHVFRWGGDIEEKYFVRMGINVISVYKIETFSLIDKKDIKVKKSHGFMLVPN